MRKIASIVLFITLFALPIGACSTNEVEHGEGHDAQQTQIGDLRQETESTSVLPAFLNEKSEEIKMVYAAAAQNQKLLEHIPCYCGCGDSVGHKDNYDCFVHKNNEDGSLVWDDHGTRCQVCLDIAAESIVMYSEGKSIKEIREYIDDKYKEGYAEPTPTPEV